MIKNNFDTFLYVALSIIINQFACHWLSTVPQNKEFVLTDYRFSLHPLLTHSIRWTGSDTPHARQSEKQNINFTNALSVFIQISPVIIQRILSVHTEKILPFLWI